MLVDYMDLGELKECIKQIKIIKLCLIIFIVSIIGTTIIPTKETMYTMIALEQVTPDNISAIGKTGENIIDYITDKIDQVVNGDSEKKE